MSNLFIDFSLPNTALSLASEYKFSVFPLQPHSKIPYSKEIYFEAHKQLDEGWKPFQLTAPSIEQVESWWEVYPNSNIAVVCGQISDLLVIDCDSEFAEAWAQVNLIRPVIAVETNRGHHYYYHWPILESDLAWLQEERAKHKAAKDGLDIQLDGCYVVAPNSVHPEGKIYTAVQYSPLSWAESGFSNELPTIRSQNSEYALGHDSSYDSAITSSDSIDLSDINLVTTEGGRNNDLTSQVGYWISLEGITDENELKRKALKYNQKFNDPPLPSKEVLTTVASICKADRKNHPERYGNNKISTINSSDMEGLEIVKPVKNVEQEWPEALFHPGGILEKIADYTDHCAPITNRKFSIGGAFSLLGTFLSHQIESPTGLKTHMYMILIGDSGCGKDAPRKAIAHILKNSQFSKYFGGSDIASDVSLARVLAAGHQPGNSSPIKLCLFDEFGHFLKATKNEKGPKYGFIKLVTELYSNCDTPYLKTYGNSDNNILIPWHGLNILGMTVPKEFYDNLQSSEATNGFLARTTIISGFYNDSKVDLENIKLIVPDDILADLQVIDNIVPKPQGKEILKNLNENFDPIKLTVASDANKYHIDATIDALEKQKKAAQKEEYAKGSFYGRWGEKAAKFWMILHASKYGAECIHIPVELETVKLAWQYVTYLDNDFFRKIENNIADSSFERATQRVLNTIDTFLADPQNINKGIPGCPLARIYSRLRDYSRKDVDSFVETLVVQNKIRLVAVLWKNKTKPYKSLYARVQEIDD